MEPALQTHLPFSAWSDPQLSRLPGVLPLEPGGWIMMDEAFRGQMALRDRLIGENRKQTVALDSAALPAAQELLRAILALLGQDEEYSIGETCVTRPDDVTVRLDFDDPLGTAGRLVQEDLCLLQPGQGGEHVLTGGAVCFPAYWSLTEKFLHPMTRIHVPVPVYDPDVARRVQRLFDAVRPERPLWRANAHLSENPDIATPAREGDHPTRAGMGAPYLRSEKQCLLRLPKTDAVVFSIHTYMIRRTDLTPDQQASLSDVMEKRIAARQLSSD